MDKKRIKNKEYIQESKAKEKTSLIDDSKNDEPQIEIDNNIKIEKQNYFADQLQIKHIDEKRVRIKDIDRLKTAESVLDVETRTTLFNLRKNNIVDYMTGIISSGKEANVYHGYAPDGKELALKVYRTSTTVFKGLQIYITGDQRFVKVKHDQRSLVFAWAKKEFKNLSRAVAAKVSVPKPIFCIKDVVVMEFIGKNGVPYPLLKNVEIEDSTSTYKEVISNMKKMVKGAGLIHADLSEYNMMYTPTIFFIDVSQSVLLDHPLAEEFLYRDIMNITNYFYQLDVKVIKPEKLYEELMGESVSEKTQLFEFK